jgi:hypothetical protein
VPYGVFYQGWTLRLLGGWLLLQPAAARDAAAEADFHARAEALAKAMAESPTHHLEAYPGGSWPVDNVVALSALRLHDQMYATDYGGVVEAWLDYTQAHLDPATGLIPHRIDAETGRAWQGARASSLVMTLSFLPEVDAALAAAQYARWRELFVQPVLGFGLVREFPRGTTGMGDVDSGPLVFGLSPVSSGVALVAARANGDVALFERLLQLSEVAGLPVTVNGQKRYSLGQLMVGDAFLAWGKTWVPWREAVAVPPAVALPILWPRVHVWAYAIAGAWAVLSLAPLAWIRRQGQGTGRSPVAVGRRT